MRKRYRLLIFAVIFLAAILWVNKFIIFSVGKMDGNSRAQDAAGKRIGATHALIPDDPAKYHIVTVDKYKPSRIKQSGAFSGQMKTPREFRRQLQTIEGQIRVYESLVKRNANDLESAKTLQNLYTLRATLLSLEDVAVRKKK